MNRSDIKRSLDATVEPLSEITRASVWQRIEDKLATPAQTRRWLPAAMFVAGAAAAAAIALVIASRGSATAPPEAGERIVVAVPVPGEYRRAFAGGELTVYGPAELELEPARPAIRIQRGTVIVRRDSALAPLLVATPESSRTVLDPVFAMRVTELSTEIASGDQRARALIERQLLTPTPPPAPAPAPPPAPPPPLAHREPPRTAAAVETPPHEPVAVPVTQLTIDAGAPPPEVAPPDAAPAETLADRYARAERALAAGDRAAARTLLDQIAREDAAGRLGATATYDLALLAVQDGDPDTALRHLNRVIGGEVEPGLHAPAQRLRCKILRTRGIACTSP